jgi:putative nucleotidyltransferase with HDIG domain
LEVEAVVVRDLKATLRRQRQIDALSYFVIFALICAVGLLIAALLYAPGVFHAAWMENEILRTLLPGLLLAFVLYMADQQRRLRIELAERDEELRRADLALQSSVDRLQFAHHTAAVMSSLPHDEALMQVLRECAHYFEADASALIGDDVHVFAEKGIDEDVATHAILPASLQAAGAGAPLATASGDGRDAVVAVPLRQRDRLRYVLCMWRSKGAFEADRVEGLELVARIIELSLDNDELLADLRAQLDGMLRLLVGLVESHKAAAPRQSALVAEFAVAVGERLGLDPRRRETLRMAALLHDIGMLEVPETLLSATRPLTDDESIAMRTHVERGANMVKLCNLASGVQEAVLAHHERMDGTGYPRGLHGPQIPLAARILATCDGYVAMTTDRPWRPRLSPRDAQQILRDDANSAYDPRVVKALLETLNVDAVAAEAILLTTGAFVGD